MSKKILVCQHVPYEILGTLNPKFKEHGFRIRYVNFGRFPQMQPALKDIDGLVILGGPMNVDETEKHPHLSYEVTMIQEALQRDIPILGICLGSQLIAKALGAKVSPNHQKEIGWYDIEQNEAGREDPLFSHFENRERIFQWHGDTFAIPDGALHLARSETCAHQAFRFGDKVYGLQFHLEVDEAMIARWLTVPGNVEELKKTFPSGYSEQILQETPQYIERLKALSHETFEGFIQLFGGCRKYRRLSSR